MRCLCSISLLSFLTATGLAQQAPFISINGPNAPKGPAFLLAARRGGLWLGGMEAGAEGLTYFDGSRFITPVTDFPKIIVTSMVEDTSGGLWIASPSGIFRVFQGKMEQRMPGSALWGMAKVTDDIFLTAVGAEKDGYRSNADIIRISSRLLKK